MKLLQLFLVSSMPVLKVIIVTLVGAFIALDRINILPEDARKHFNHVVFFVFNPALIFANLARTLTLKSLITLWYMPLNILITFMAGSLLGWVVIHVTRAPSHLRGLILGCSSAGNLGNMLLIMIPAVCNEKSSPFGDPAVCLEYGMAYVSVSLAVGSIYLWSYVYNIVRISSTKNANEVEGNLSQNAITNETENTSPVSDTVVVAVPLKDTPISTENADLFILPYSISNHTVEAPSSLTVRQRMRILSKKMNLKKVLSPSTIGVIIGFIVGVVTPFRKILIGGSAPLHVIHDSVTLLGDGAIPTASLIMGGNLTKGLKGSGVRMSIIIGILSVRYIILPLFGIVVVKGAIHMGFVHPDPLYKFVLLLQFAMPPASNISTITQMFGAGESECSIIMLWAYALASVALTLWSLLYMWLVA